MEDLFKGIGGDDAPISDAQTERAIRAAEVMVQTLKIRANELTSAKSFFLFHLFFLVSLFSIFKTYLYIT